MQRNITVNPVELMDIVQDHLKGKGDLKSDETIETVNFNYDFNNDVKSITFDIVK